MAPPVLKAGRLMKVVKSDRHPFTRGASLEILQEFFQPLISLLHTWGYSFRREAVNQPRTLSERITEDLSARTGLRNFELVLTRAGVDEKEINNLWQSVAPLLEAVAFDEAATRLYSEALRATSSFGKVRLNSMTEWKAADAMELQASLDFYHYILPRLMLVVATARTIAGTTAPEAASVPASHAAPVDQAFARLRSVLIPRPRNSAKRLERLWADYDERTRDSRRPLSERDSYRRATARILDLAAQLSETLKKSLSADVMEKVVSWGARLQRMESVLPALLMNVTILNFHFRPAGTIARPAPVGASPVQRVAAPRRQAVRPRRLEAPYAELVPA